MRIIITETNFPALLAACAITTSNSITVLMKETHKCSLTKVEVTTGSTNCLATGLINLYLCAGLQPKTTYTISAITITWSANGSVLKTTLDTAVCTTGECECAIQLGGHVHSTVIVKICINYYIM